MTNETLSGCGCGGSAVAVGSAAVASTTGCTGFASVSRERTRYFARQLVGADDLTQDQLYQREKSRRHNRMLHGWGIVCGARVRLGSVPCEVVVEAGYILGPYGDEIQLDAAIAVDVCSEDLDGNVASSCGPVEPWCADVRVDRPSGRPVYLAVAYADCLSRPVRAVSDGCGCDDTLCEYSRIRDSYRLVVLDDLPSTYPPGAKPPEVSHSVSCPPRADAKQGCNCPQCATCPTAPWVILADLTVEGGAITTIDCDSHRRYVASFGSFYFSCEAEAPPREREIRTKLERSLRPEAIKAFEEAGQLTTAPVGKWTGDRLSVEGIDQNSAIGRRLKELTIAEIAAQGRAAFVDAMVSATSRPRRAKVADQADDVWTKAADVIITLSST
ncbi:hypothetical protein [Kribbella ginsengisoli]|uniref:Uncharacterized protein n=1 Tax=Kribbella ginsengisoli TaxID=363865 RepID=A0ABP6VNT4_9ACTN